MTVKRGFRIAVILGCILGGLFAQADQNLTIPGHIRNIAPEYGNLNTSFTQADLDQLGLVSLDQFLLHTENRYITITLGQQYADVPSGQWIGFIDWEGFLRIAIHYGNAAEQLTVHQHSQLQLSRPID